MYQKVLNIIVNILINTSQETIQYRVLSHFLIIHLFNKLTKKTILNSFTKLYLHNIFTIHNISNSPFQNYKYKLPEYKSSAFPRTMNDQISFSSNRNSMQKFKVVLVGDQNVGKSSMIARYIRNEFDPTKNPTIGIDFVSKNIAVMGKMVRLQLWDTAGQERFKSLIPSYLKDAHLAIVVFDLTNINSVQNLNKWIDFIRESGRTQIQIYVVGNKLDMENQISNQARRTAQDIAEKQAEQYKEVSAKTAANIDQLFTDILQGLVNQANAKKNEQTKVGESKPQEQKAPVSNQGQKISLNKPQQNNPQAQGGCCSK